MAHHLGEIRSTSKYLGDLTRLQKGASFHKDLVGMRKADSGELLRDSLDMLILKAVEHGALHGYAIASLIQQRSDSVLKVEEGALYPALHRLEVRGLLDSGWGLSEATDERSITG